MKARMNETILIPFVGNQPFTTVTLSIIDLTEGTLILNASAMTETGLGLNTWTKSWLVPMEIEKYQCIIVADGIPFTGEIIEVDGNISFVATTGSGTGNVKTADAAIIAITTADYWKAKPLLRALTGNNKGQVVALAASSSYAVSGGTVATFTLDPATQWANAPASGDKYELIIN